ncbi:MAG: TldD/PmbA family protein [Bdellovibrionota bacterium]
MQNLPFQPEAALKKAREKSEWASLRFSRETTTFRTVRNDKPEKNESSLEEGVMAEVLVDGHFGHAATADLSPEGIQRAFDRAMATTKATAKHKVFSFTTEQRPVAKGEFRSPRKKALDATSLAEITDCLLAGSKAMQASPLVVNRAAGAILIQTEIGYFSSNGSDTRQAFDMVSVNCGATAAEGTESQSRHWAPTGQWGGEIFNRATFTAECARVGQEALELLKAENCPSGAMDLVLMPDQMMLQIHESIGHPLEIDRILGDERNYAGWSFVKNEDFGRLQYGSKLMNVTFDPTVAGEFASYAFDDGGYQATREFLIKDGVLQRGLGALESQKRSQLKGVANFRSSSWNRAPIDRMANINLEPGTSSLEDLISQAERGVWMTTNRSWSIDDYRNKFQFGCEYARLIENGKLTKTVRNPNYRGITVDFWNRLAAVGRLDTLGTFGTPYCGKGEPSQVIRVGHASPPCLFRGVEVFGGGQ